GRELVRRPAWDLAPEEVEAGVYAVTIETDMPPLEAPPGAPPHPVPVRARSVGDGRSVALEWEATGAASYRLYAHTRELEANRYPIGHTTETHAVVTDLPGNVYVSVQSVGESGLSRTPLSPPFEVVPTMGAATRPVALRLAPPAGLVLQR